MEEYTLQFKDDTDRIIVTLMIILSVFATFIPSIMVVLLCTTSISENSLKFAKELFNFETTLFLVGAICYIINLSNVTALISIVNILFLLAALVAISQNLPIKLIKSIKILK